MNTFVITVAAIIGAVLSLPTDERVKKSPGYGGPGLYGGAIVPGVAAASIGGGFGPAVASGPAIGVFPNANIGGCAIPILLSCSPKLASGQLVKSHSAGYSAPSYRSNEEEDLETEELEMHPEMEVKSETPVISDMERTASLQNLGQPHMSGSFYNGLQHHGVGGNFHGHGHHVKPNLHHQGQHSGFHHHGSGFRDSPHGMFHDF